DRLAAAEPGLERRHRKGGVLSEHRHDRPDVAAVPRLDIAVDDLPQAIVAERAKRYLLASVWQPLPDGLARALQRAVDGGRGRVERLGDLTGREAENLAHDQYRALICRKVLQRRDEGELDALPLLIARFRSGEPVGQPELLIRIGLHPDRLDQGLA